MVCTGVTYSSAPVPRRQFEYQQAGTYIGLSTPSQVTSVVFYVRAAKNLMYCRMGSNRWEGK